MKTLDRDNIRNAGAGIYSHPATDASASIWPENAAGIYVIMTL